MNIHGSTLLMVKIKTRRSKGEEGNRKYVIMKQIGRIRVGTTTWKMGHFQSPNIVMVVGGGGVEIGAQNVKYRVGKC